MSSPLFDFETYRRLLLAGAMDELCAELDVYRCIHNAQTRAPPAPLALDELLMRFFVATLRDPACSARAQEFFVAQRLAQRVNVVTNVGQRATLVVYEAIRANNCGAVRFLFGQGAVLQTLEMDYNPVLDLVCSAAIGEEMFHLIVGTMALGKELPVAWQRKRTIMDGLSLSAAKIRGLVDQGADFAAWRMQHHLDGTDTLFWCIDEKFINCHDNAALLAMLTTYVPRRTKTDNEIACALAQHLTGLPEALPDPALDQWLVTSFVHMPIPDTATQVQTLKNVFFAVGLTRLRAMVVEGYPVLLYCAKHGKQAACEQLVALGLPKQQERTHAFARTETGRSLARENGYLALADWFTEKPVVIRRRDEPVDIAA